MTTNREVANGYTEFGYDNGKNVYHVKAKLENPFIVEQNEEDASWKGIKNEAIRNKEIRHKIIYYMLETMYYTGMRPAECLALTRDDIKDGFISITKELGSDKKKSNVVRRPKTPNSIRKIPIHPNLQIILNELQKFAMYDELYVDENGKYMNSTDIGNTINRIAKANGIKFNMYMLRHYFATELVTNQTDQRTTMELLGHGNYSMSLYYANSNDELKEQAIELIS